MNKKKRLDKYYYHEALDRSYIVLNQAQELLADHPVFIKHKKLKKRIRKVILQLSEIYQITGDVNTKK